MPPLTIYFIATIAIAAHWVISAAILAWALRQNSLSGTLFIPILFGIVSSYGFLYLFSHRNFMKFSKAIEEKEGKTESIWLSKFEHMGKLITIIVIGIIAGPIFSALTVKLLAPHYKYRYLLVVTVSIPSTLLYVGIAKGFISLL